jgi:predicted kinase
VSVQCVILVGLPGAGKTTFYRHRLGAGYEHISKDLFPHARSRQGRQDALLRAALSRGRSVVVDNTNASPAERAGTIAIAREYGACIVAHYIRASTGEAVSRNEQRGGRGKVPKVAIFTCAKRLVPPSEEEGFDEVHWWRVSGPGTFEEVEPRPAV